MRSPKRIVLVAIGVCSALLGACDSGNPSRGALSGSGGSSQGGSVGSGGGTAGAGSGGLESSTSSGGGIGAGGTARSSVPATGGRSAGGQTGKGGAGTAGGLATGGAVGMGGAAVIGSGGRNGSGGSGIGGATGTVKATGGATGTGGAAGNGAGGSAVGGRGSAGGSTGGASAGGTAVSREGFYKELFMDVGVGLDHQTTLPAADRNGWEWEFVSTDDVNVQHSYMWGDTNDDNGVLLYPDREPRFMVIWTGGGYGDHAGPVGAQGIKNVQDFFNNGGSYSGSCNGNYMAWNWAYKLWPGKINVDTYEGLVDGTIPDDSPILKYFDFGGDHLITGLQHYQGGYEIDPLPAGTEVLLIGKTHANAIDGNGHPTSYAYKPSAKTGRVCGMNDHPEYAFQPGEVMNFFQACLRYAHDGVGEPDVKDSLSNGVERVMDRSSADNKPAYTRIGDKQYHHFAVALPEGAKDLTVTLNGDPGYDLNLYIAKGDFAFASRATQKDSSAGASKTLTVAAPESGTWYVGVECATTVTATKTSHGYDYSGNLAVLNGVKYSIKAGWTE